MIQDRRKDDGLATLALKTGIVAMSTLITLFITTAWSHEARIRVLETQWTAVHEDLQEIKGYLKK